MNIIGLSTIYDEFERINKKSKHGKAGNTAAVYENKSITVIYKNALLILIQTKKPRYCETPYI